MKNITLRNGVILGDLMLKNIDYKPEDGKLIRLEVDISQNKINNIKITGDFFMYPEEGIEKIENVLIGKNILKGKEIVETIEEVIKKNNINIIGFTADDILFALQQDKKIKIGIAQIDISLADKESNLRKISSLVSEASQNKCDIICFPEYFTTGSALKNFEELAEEIPGKTIDLLCALAKENKISLVGSIVEKQENKFYNTSIFIDSEGKVLGKNRKRNLFLMESVYVSSSKDCEIVNTNNGKLGMMICYDSIFPEVARELALKDVKIIFVPANWPDPFLHQWKLATSARALDNQLWIVAVNRCGKDNQFTYFGNSCVINPYGEVVLNCGTKECLNFFEIDLNKSNEFKQKVNFLKDLKKFK